MNPTQLYWIEPGAGAIAYARERIAGLSRDEAAPVIRELIANPLDDKRVKRCEYCGYPWRDDSLRNTKRTCSDECKTALKTLQRRRQRADKALLEGEDAPPKKRAKRHCYVWWLEYPFWLNEYEMLKRSWKYEVPYDPSKLAYMRKRSMDGNERI